MVEWLGDLDDPAGVNAIRADENTSRLAVHPRLYLLQIGPPAPLGLIVGVADVVSYRASLAADGTDSCHDYCLRILSIMSVVEWPLR